jgi:hypothetical protein
MWVILLSVSDDKFHVPFTAEERGKTLVKKEYSLQEPPLAEQDRNPASLEQRVYKMTNRLIATILEDPNFPKVITAP